MSPTQLSLRSLRAAECTVDVVEYWNSFTKKRKDLYGFVDIVAVQTSVWFVQTTTRSNMSSRIQKIASLPAADACLLAGARILVHGWHKVGARWQVKAIELLPEHLAGLRDGTLTTRALLKGD